MKQRTHFILCSILFVFVVLQGISAQQYETMDMHLAIELKQLGTGVEQVNERLLFSFSSAQPTRLVGIAFLHEDFRVIHSFFRNPQGVFVLPYLPPDSVSELVYRLVVDGIWMRDPKNDHVATLPGGIKCSSFSLQGVKKESPPAATRAEKGQVIFQYPDEQADSVTVAGDFNHWDPFMYSLNRDPSRDDLYSLSLVLPRGTYYYYFVVDGRRVVDPGNPRIVRKNDGTLVSVLNVRS